MIRKLGSGAFATVYLAEDTRMGRSIAIKVVEDADDSDGRAVREAQAAAKLDHAHIVTVHEVVSEPDRTLLFTEYVQGHTLRELYSRRRLTDAQLLRAGIQIAGALEHAHKRGVIHRDIKPENLMLVASEDVDVRVMDFGVAKLEDLSSVTIDGDLVGTLAYMAPEQLAGRPVDPKVDVYSLSLTLYEGFTGSNPLRGKNPAELLRGPSRMVFSRLARSRPDLPAVLDEALQLGLEKDPAKRPDAVALRRMLEQAAKEMPEIESTPTLGERAAAAFSAAARAERLAYAGRHLVAGAASLATAGYVLPRAPFYPEVALLPLAAGAAFLTLLSPAAGGALTLALVAPPFFEFGLGWGILYVLVASSTFALLLWRRKEWLALVPGAAPAMVAIGAGLALPALSGFLARRWGPLVGGLAGLAVAIAGALGVWGTLPFVFSSVSGAGLSSARHVGSPGSAVQALARMFDQRPELLLQVGLFALFAVPWWAMLAGTVPRRLWTATLYLGLMFSAFVLAPPLVAGVSVNVGAFLRAFWPCVIIGYLLALLAPARSSVTAPEG
ncbi:MAG TPA: serine/threonine-protein kinase [Thermoleophilia bacterium]|nr:serine/threonine-protein kinase [Thermoleophilia bacterium]